MIGNSDSEEDVYYDTNHDNNSRSSSIEKKNSVNLKQSESSENTDDDFYDANEGSDNNNYNDGVPEVGRGNKSKRTSLDPSNYARLQNFKGLSGPIKNISLDEKASLKDSAISSLSSLSIDAYQDVQNERNISKETTISDDKNFKEVLFSKTLRQPPSRPNLAKEHLDFEEMKEIYDQRAAFNKVFSKYDTSGNKNPFFRARMSVLGTIKPKYSIFKDNLYHIQTLRYHVGAIWAMKFSPQGNYLATGGQDSKLLVWIFGDPPANDGVSSFKEGLKDEDEAANEIFDTQVDENGELDEIKAHPNSRNNFSEIINEEVDALEVDLNTVIYPEPVKVFIGHTADIIDIAWSKSNFILSSSIDKTVRLWHVTRSECLQFFRHPDIVTSIDFHPIRDRYFISGCFDRRLRVWDIIPDGNVKEWAQTPDTITSVCFSPDGLTVVGGLMHGQIYFFEYDGMKYKTQIDCSNKSGKYKKGTKVTGMFYRSKIPISLEGNPSENPEYISQRKSRAAMQNAQLLVTTNDHRIRLFQLDDYSFLYKYKGIRNKSMQIKASFSDDGNYIICGSESGSVAIWNTEMKSKSKLSSIFNKSDRNEEYESFFNTSKIDFATTVALFAPHETMKLVLSNYAKTINEVLYFEEHMDQIKSQNNVATEEDEEKNYFDPEYLIKKKIEMVSYLKNNVQSDNVKLNSLSQMKDFSTRIIVTADYDGIIRLYFRLS